MFTQQVGQLDKLEGKVPSEVLEVLRGILGNCAQELVHRGPVVFEGPVTFSDGSGLINYAKATAKWVNVTPTASYVPCVKSDRLGVSTGVPVLVFLPHTQATHPNVRTDDVLSYMLDSGGTAIAVSDYLDDRIGTIKAWGDPNNIPGGWQAVASGATIFGYSEGDEDFGTVGDSGGSKTHTHEDHDASEIADHSGASTGSGGGGSLTFTGSTGSTTSDPPDVSEEEDIISGTGTVETAIQSANPTLSGGSGYAVSELVDVVDPGHYHDVTANNDVTTNPTSTTVRDTPTDTDPTLMTFAGQKANGSGGDETPSTTGFHVALDKSQLTGLSLSGDHTHDVSLADIAAGLEANPHTHEVTMNAHSHTLSGSGSVSAHTHTIPTLSHSGTLTHDSPKHLPPYLVKVWIERYE